MGSQPHRRTAEWPKSQPATSPGSHRARQHQIEQAKSHSKLAKRLVCHTVARYTIAGQTSGQPQIQPVTQTIRSVINRRKDRYVAPQLATHLAKHRHSKSATSHHANSGPQVRPTPGQHDHTVTRSGSNTSTRPHDHTARPATRPNCHTVGQAYGYTGTCTHI